MQTANHLTIVNNEIRQLDGLYSLNDLHAAAGGEAKHQPRYFLANQQTQDLISAIGSDSGIPLSVKKGGANQGTYASKELVYAYAMWINPAFHLKVIRAFDALQTGAVPPAPTSPTMADALGIYRDSVQALLLTQPMQQAHTLACKSASRATGIDLESLWAAPPVAPLPLHIPGPDGTVRIARPVAEVKAKILRVVKEARRYRAAAYYGLTRQGVMPYGYALTLCKVPSDKFRQLIDEMLAAGAIRQAPPDIYMGGMMCFVAGGAA